MLRLFRRSHQHSAVNLKQPGSFVPDLFRSAPTETVRLALLRVFSMALPSQTGRAAAQIDGICSDVAEMRGVLELQTMLLWDLAQRENQMKGFCKTNLSSHGQDLERFKVDTAEAIEKIWNKR